MKNVFKTIYNLPGTIFSGITSFVFGSSKKADDGSFVKSTFKNANNDDVEVNVDNPSVFAGLSYAARAFGNFVANHKTAISTAFWSSLVLAGAAALTVAFWPAGLAAVVAYQVAGFSIAALVGTGFAAQVAAVSALAFAATSAAVYAATTLINGTKLAISGIKTAANWVAAKFSSNDDDSSDDNDADVPNSNVRIEGQGSFLMPRSVAQSNVANFPSPLTAAQAQPAAQPAAEAAPAAPSASN